MEADRRYFAGAENERRWVRLLLQRGVPTRDVAELIGDTEDMVVKHYTRWVPERQERLTNILREKLATGVSVV